MALIEAAVDAVVVEGELLDGACEQFGRALDSLRESGITGATVDLSRVSMAASEPIRLLFAAWLDMYKQGRAPYLKAPSHIWQMLGRAAVDQGFLKRPAASAPAGCTR